MTPDQRAREIRAVKAKLLDELTAVQALRKADPCDWVHREQRAMLDALNAERISRGFSMLTLGDVQRIERQALGHVDYSSKFALYCAEVATDPEWTP